VSKVRSVIILSIATAFLISFPLLILSKGILDFRFNPSEISSLIPFIVSAIWLIVRWSLHFVTIEFFFQTIIVTSVKSLDHSNK
jgi:hypothetical protein